MEKLRPNRADHGGEGLTHSVNFRLLPTAIPFFSTFCSYTTSEGGRANSLTEGETRGEIAGFKTILKKWREEIRNIRTKGAKTSKRAIENGRTKQAGQTTLQNYFRAPPNISLYKLQVPP